VIFLLLYQPALSEYDFTIRSLFEDLQDGIILCRVVQLLLSDASIIVVRNCVILG
jgi:abnormal spindle-like microcephaly-associated protein